MLRSVKLTIISVSQSRKRRKTTSDPGIEFITISDDEDSEQVALDLSIVVAPVKRRTSLDPSLLVSHDDGQPSTPKLLSQAIALKNRPKRTLLEAVELPRMRGFKIQRRMCPCYGFRCSDAELAWTEATFDSPADISPCNKKTITQSRSASRSWHQNGELDQVTLDIARLSLTLIPRGG